jgi:hypothetical protein
MAIDNRGDNGIMTSKENLYDRREYPSISRETGKLHNPPTRTESDTVSESQSPSRTPQDEQRGAGGMGETASDSGNAHSKESDGERGAGHDSMESGNPAGHIAVAERLAPKPKDLVLNEQSDIGFNAGAATKFDANLLAIKTLKDIENRNGQATPEEQKIISRFSGWGDSGFSEAFPTFCLLKR